CGILDSNNLSISILRTIKSKIAAVLFYQLVNDVLNFAEENNCTPMAQTVAFAILGAFLLSITYVPMMSALFLSKKTEHKRNISDRIMEFFQRLYTPLIEFSLKRKMVVLIT
ncbi:MAG: efflux RND transporter permease subunit, partial [Bacteroidetes bacterium]|nr:efflux RND transporter permease subunit [Bacteroidota bacterium]